MFIKICAKLLLCNGLHKYFAKKMPKFCKKSSFLLKKRNYSHFLPCSHTINDFIMTRKV